MFGTGISESLWTLIIVSGVMCAVGVALIVAGVIQNISQKNKKKKTNINNTRRFY